MSSVPDSIPAATPTATPASTPAAAPTAAPAMAWHELLRADIAFIINDWRGSRVLYAFEVMLKILLYPRLQSVILFRLSQACYQSRLSLVAYWLQGVGLRRTGAEIHPAAQIGPGFCLVHSAGVVIGNRARIGSYFTCFQNVTIGDLKGDGQPEIGDWVTASAGAKILGGISVGAGTIIGANAVVLRDTPAGSVAVGIPARIARVYPVDELGRQVRGKKPTADADNA